MFVLPKGNKNMERKNVMKKKIVCATLAVTMLISTSVSAEPWWLGKYRVTFDNELGIVGDVTLQFASDGGSFIRPVTKRYGETISLERYVPTKYGYTFAGWFTDPRTKVNRVTTFTFTKPDVVYAKWEKNPEEPIHPNDEIMTKDTCYLTDEETKIRNEIIKEKAYIEGFGYAAPSKTKTIVASSDGDINKMVGTMD
ncbi:MAG: hypothetical protein E7400_02080 [Ruminococcaceae bacterium]|nr:hypothetical protein [Oscillospiraceae bacterium]